LQAVGYHRKHALEEGAPEVGVGLAGAAEGCDFEGKRAHRLQGAGLELARLAQYGAKRPEEMLFREELLALVDRTDINCLLTVDKDATGAWENHVGMLHTLFDHAKIEPLRTYAAVCGPPVVYKFIPRRMKCGIGKCGHCGIGYKYTCLQGPIFTYWDAINLPEMI
jgi:hypothetical protein